MERPPGCLSPIRDAGFAVGRLQLRERILFEVSWSSPSAAGTEGASDESFQFWLEPVRLVLEPSCSSFCSIGLKKSTYQRPLWDTRLSSVHNCQSPDTWLPSGHHCSLLSDLGFEWNRATPAPGLGGHPGLSPSGQLIPLTIMVQGRAVRCIEIFAGNVGAGSFLLAMILRRWARSFYSHFCHKKKGGSQQWGNGAERLGERETWSWWYRFHPWIQLCLKLASTLGRLYSSPLSQQIPLSCHPVRIVVSVTCNHRSLNWWNGSCKSLATERKRTQRVCSTDVGEWHFHSTQMSAQEGLSLYYGAPSFRSSCECLACNALFNPCNSPGVYKYFYHHFIDEKIEVQEASLHLSVWSKLVPQDFGGHPVVGNQPANAGNMGLIPGPGISHMPRSS